MIYAIEGHAPPTSYFRTIPRRGNNPHGSGNGDFTGDLRLPSLGKELDISGLITQALVLEGVIGLLLCYRMDERQESGAQASASVSNEGKESESFFGVELVVVRALCCFPCARNRFNPGPQLVSIR